MPGLVRIAVTMLVVLAPAAGPAAAQSYPNRTIRVIVGYPPGGAVDLIARLYGQALSIRLGQPVVPAARIRSDYEKYGKLIRSIGVKVE